MAGEVSRIEAAVVVQRLEKGGEPMGRYWQIEKKGQEAAIYIYGDIVSEPWKWYESDVTSHEIVKEIEGLDVDVINCYINSYGGEVAEGLAIYNALKRHKAKVRTYCDGFACSAASVVFMAGDERIMSASSMLMIHNAWMWAAGDANELRKQADDLEKINEASNNAYLEHINISKEQLQEMLDKETWLTAQEALDMGFCTTVVNDPASKKAANQSARMKIVQLILEHRDGVKEPRAALSEDMLKALEDRLMQRIAQQQQDNPALDEPKQGDPEPDGKGLFNFLEALASKLNQDKGDD